MKRGIRTSIFSRCTISSLCILLGLLLLAAPITTASAWDQTRITVMTRNLYLGADIFKVVEAAEEDPTTLPNVVAEVYQTMLFTNFWVRAQAIADEIACNRPDVIGLQEVSTFYIQTPGDFLMYIPEYGLVPNPNQTPAGEVVIDFYEVLNDALEDRGMYYEAFSVTNADVELPMADFNAGPPFYLSDIRMVDHDYILVRNDNDATSPLTGHYSKNLSLEMAGTEVVFKRGYLAVDVDVKGEEYRFVSTHLEVASSPGSIFRVVQAAQMKELLTILSSERKPVIMVGDFNSSPKDMPFWDRDYGLIIPPYLQATFCAWYLDSWLLQLRHDKGYTSGFDEYVSDPSVELTERIDLIFLKPRNLLVCRVVCDVVGDEVADMIENPNPDPNLPSSDLWPSDHAGVVARFTFIPLR